MKLHFVKVGKSDACIRPLFANSCSHIYTVVWEIFNSKYISWVLATHKNYRPARLYSSPHDAMHVHNPIV